MERVLIVGCGYVGSVLARELASDRHTVFGVRRSSAPLPAGVARVDFDATSPIDPAVVPDDLDVMVYAVAAKSRDESAYRAAYVDGLSHVLEALSKKPRWPRRVLFTSSTAVYAQSDGGWVDESSPAAPATFSGRIMLEAEARLSGAPTESVSLRLGGIYGPGRDSRLRAVAEGRAVLSSGPPHYTNRIHRDDAAGALRHLIFGPASPAVVLGVDDEPASERMLVEWMAQIQGIAIPAVAELDAEPARRSGSKRCRNSLLRSLGYRFRYPTFRDGYAALIKQDARDGPLAPSACRDADGSVLSGSWASPSSVVSSRWNSSFSWARGRFRMRGSRAPSGRVRGP